MKKLILMVLTFLMALTVSGCKTNTEDTSTSEETVEEAEDELAFNFNNTEIINDDGVTVSVTKYRYVVDDTWPEDSYLEIWFEIDNNHQNANILDESNKHCIELYVFSYAINGCMAYFNDVTERVGTNEKDTFRIRISENDCSYVNTSIRNIKQIDLFYRITERDYVASSQWYEETGRLGDIVRQTSFGVECNETDDPTIRYDFSKVLYEGSGITVYCSEGEYENALLIDNQNDVAIYSPSYENFGYLNGQRVMVDFSAANGVYIYAGMKEVVTIGVFEIGNNEYIQMPDANGTLEFSMDFYYLERYDEITDNVWDYLCSTGQLTTELNS